MHEKQLGKILKRSKHSLFPTSITIPNTTFTKAICKKFTQSSHVDQYEE